MTDHMPDDISPTGRDLRAYTDELRSKHAVVHNTLDEWVLLRHGDVVAAALDHERFSSQVSRYLQIPNGLDGTTHTDYRNVIERYLSYDALAPFIPVFERIATQLMAELPKNKVLDAVMDIGAVFAVRAQCEWLGWPKELEPQLLAWMSANHAATRSGDTVKMASVAESFDTIIHSIILPRRSADSATNSSEYSDVTAQLCREKISVKETIIGHEQTQERLLTEAELISILRNWTGGDLGSLALCIGVLVAHIAQTPERIEWLRTATNSETEAFIDEVLRLDDPFVSNRRITTCPVHIGGRTIPAGARVKFNWTSANRDEAVFDNNQFNPEKNAAANLVYGIGKHVCPGRLLATWELRIMLQALLANVQTLRLAPNQPIEREVAPAGGYHRVPVIFS